MHRYSIIVVEDDKSHREQIEHGLTLAGFAVTAVSSPIEFYQRLVNQSFDALILDIDTPDHSFFSILHYIKDNKLNSSMGVLVLTSADNAECRAEGYELGVDLCVVKPINIGEIVPAVKNIIGRIEQPNEESLSSRLNAWQLDTGSWQLLAPNGAYCKLSAKEMTLIKKLYNPSGQVLNKYLLGAALGYSDDEHGKRALESAILRLRRKFADMGCTDMPIKTAHGVGYTFSAKLEIS